MRTKLEMEIEIDHYQVLGLPSGSTPTQNEISKAYRSKALELHPDKRLNDPNAHANFQKLKSSYEILKDEKARKLFHHLLRVKREQRQRQRRSQYDSKRRRMVSDLEERERDPGLRKKQEEDKIAKQFSEEIERIRAMHNVNMNKAAAPTAFSSPFPVRHVEHDIPVPNHLVGASYQDKENSILDKLRKAAEKQK